MNDSENLKFTGEFFIPGESGERIEADHMERYRFASRYAGNKTVLDIACGTGYAAPLFIEAGAVRYQGVDLNDKLVNYASVKYGSDSAGFCAGDICTFHAGKVYDLITCFETIEHIENYRSALSNLFRLLRPGGLLLISSPNRPVTSPYALRVSDPPANSFHVQEFTPGELVAELRAAGFAAGKNDIFGQRQRRWVFHNRSIRRLVERIFRVSDSTGSAEVTPVKHRVPRYFIITARKRRPPTF